VGVAAHASLNEPNDRSLVDRECRGRISVCKVLPYFRLATDFADSADTASGSKSNATESSEILAAFYEAQAVSPRANRMLIKVFMKCPL